MLKTTRPKRSFPPEYQDISNMMTTVISSKEEIVTHRADVLIIGGGGAGTRAAIEIAERGKRALLVTKGQITHSGITPLAQTSYQAVFDPDDTFDLHFRDTDSGGVSVRSHSSSHPPVAITMALA